MIVIIGTLAFRRFLAVLHFDLSFKSPGNNLRHPSVPPQLIVGPSDVGYDSSCSVDLDMGAKYSESGLSMSW